MRSGLLEAWSIANDERAFAFVNVFECFDSLNALAPPRMQIRIGKLRKTANGIVGVLCALEDGRWKNGIESLLHSVLNLAVAPPSITNACPVIKEDCSLSARK